MTAQPHFQPKPEWLRVPANSGATNQAVTALLRSLDLHTVCEEASCPNCGECFGNRTAAFMILGRDCTRRCTFCCVSKGLPQPPDPAEPERVAAAAASLNLLHVVVTSVTRDDLPDGGASHFVRVTEAIRTWPTDSHPTIELLIPDFQGDEAALRQVVAARPDVLNHNIETVPRLYPAVRPQADYRRSLDLLGRARRLDNRLTTKSGIMVGLGETPAEVLAVMADLRRQDCRMLTIGQYLAPTRQHHPVIDYVTPAQFARYRDAALQAGFADVSAGPLVRSSYHAKPL